MDEDVLNDRVRIDMYRTIFLVEHLLADVVLKRTKIQKIYKKSAHR